MSVIVVQTSFRMTPLARRVRLHRVALKKELATTN